MLADSVGLALLVGARDARRPPSGLAFVLHDMFARAVRGDRPDRRQNARGGPATRQPRRGAACRAPRPNPDSRPHRTSARSSTAFLAASRARRLRCAARGARPGRRLPASTHGKISPLARPPITGAADVDDAAALARLPVRAAGATGPRQRHRRAGRRTPAQDRFAVVGFTLAHGRIVAIDLITDPDKLRGLAPRASKRDQGG